MESWKKKLIGFLFPPQGDNWITILRVGLGLQILFYALSLEKDWNYVFSGSDEGLNGRALAEGLLSTQSPLVPRLGWLIALGGSAGFSEWTVLSVAWWFLLLAGVGLIAGILSRSSAVLSWFLHLCAAKSGGLVSYGVDNFMTIGLFYLMLSPLPDRASLDWRLRRRLPKAAELSGFFRRVLQVHLCFIYFFSGLTKGLGSGWWDGSNLWRALIRPPFDLIDPHTLLHWKSLFPAAGIGILTLELGYPFFIWSMRTRRLWIVLICAMHVGIALTMGMYLFGLVMIVLNLAGFAPETVWSGRKRYQIVDLPTSALRAH